MSVEHAFHFGSQILVRLRGLVHEHFALGGLFFERGFKEIPYLAKPFGCHFFIVYAGWRERRKRQVLLSASTAALSAISPYHWIRGSQLSLEQFRLRLLQRSEQREPKGVK